MLDVDVNEVFKRFITERFRLDSEFRDSVCAALSAISADMDASDLVSDKLVDEVVELRQEVDSLKEQIEMIKGYLVL